MYIKNIVRNIHLYLLTHTSSSLPIIRLYGLIAYLNFVIFSYLWSDNLDINNVELYLRIMCGVLCLPLIFANTIARINTAVLSYYWYFTLLINFPIFGTYLFLQNNGSEQWLINIVIGLFWLILLVDVYSFLILLTIGICIGYYLFIFINGSKINYLTESFINSLSLYFFSILIGTIFAGKRYLLNQENIELLEQQVNIRTMELKKALKIKNDFLNNMSHEIRTPLQGIIGISHSLIDSWENLSNEQRKMLAAKISNNGDRLMRLVSNLLDLAKLENNKMSFTFDYYDLAKICEEVIDEFETTFNNYKISFITNPKHSYIAYFDQVRISQVIRNLLSNAIKFGNEKNIKITINKDKTTIKLAITDEGVGIPKIELSHIFNPFEESTITKSKAGGTGLGLAICKEIITAHKGSIYAESAKGKTTFTVILPTAISSPPIIQNNSSLNILLIDDEDACLTSGELILTSLGHSVTIAQGGKEALLKLNNIGNKFDLILLDLMMPDIYGINVLKLIKSSPALESIPVIVQSGIADPNEITRAFKFGAVDFIRKPYVKTNIIEIINKAGL